MTMKSAAGNRTPSDPGAPVKSPPVSRSRRALSARIALSLTAFVPFCILYAADIRASGNAAFIVTESPLRIPAGDAVHFHAYIKTAGVTGGIAALCWQRLDGGVQAMHFDPASINGATGTTGWQPFELNIPPFPVDATIRMSVTFPCPSNVNRKRPVPPCPGRDWPGGNDGAGAKSNRGFGVARGVGLVWATCAQRA